ncbi:hypothetical protein [Mycobacterium sp.]|uniref:hypothetical protein n=1 Tax=Mycobacterium sp. TaxID=1785 RepID=UPI003BAA1808
MLGQCAGQQELIGVGYWYRGAEEGMAVWVDADGVEVAGCGCGVDPVSLVLEGVGG